MSTYFLYESTVMKATRQQYTKFQKVLIPHSEKQTI